MMGCVRPILQGDSYLVPIKLKIDGQYINLEDVKKIEFTFGDLKKYYTGEITYDENSNSFLFPLSQEETIAFQGPQQLEVRVKFIDDTVVGRLYGKVEVMYGASVEVL